jgi:hypothetical protein
MKIWRSHPVLFAALIGAVIGLANALLIEIPGLIGTRPGGVLALLKPASRASNDGNVLETAVILVIEVGANVLVFALLFSLAGLLFIAIRSLFRRIRSLNKS